jgi:alkylhydroperoxidase/carboxymuconolactone decarboxylase family protein YurZ
MVDRDELFRRLTLGDASYLEILIRERASLPAGHRLDPTGEVLVKIGALAATDGSGSTWQRTIAAALDAGLTTDQVIDALAVLTPVLGMTRVVEIAPKLALAVGLDVDAMLEVEHPVHPTDEPRGAHVR